MILSDLDNIVYNKFANGEITLTEYIKYQNRDKMINYENKYKQALSRATFYNNELLTENQRKMLLDIFPELTEDEDEQIRKKLICFVENWKKFNPNSPFDDYAVYTSDSDECDRILTWLEKQDDINEISAEWSEKDEQMILSIEQVMNCASLLNIVPEKIDNIKSWLKSLRPQKQWKPSTAHKREIDDAYLQGICDAKHEIEKQGEQLDPDKVIEWLKTKVYDDSAYGMAMIKQFKKDFGL